MEEIKRKPLFNPEGDIDVRNRRMINFNTTNINDFNNMRYEWVSDWYRQAMNNFWVPEEINLNQDKSDYPKLSEAERRAYDKILSFLVYLDSLQSANLPNISQYVTANEVNLCLSRPSRSVSTAKATAICWIPFVILRKETTFSTNGRQMSISYGEMSLSEISTMSLWSGRIRTAS